MKEFLRVWPGLMGIVVVLVSVASADQKIDVHVPGGGAQDLLNMTSVPSEISDSTHDNSMTRACTTPHGRVIRENEPGYSDCMALLQGEKLPSPSPKPSPTL
jgi:hypothetical protein